MNQRASGVLLHPTSLPSPFGIGDLGKDAYDFIDFLYDAGQKYWQILPLCPVGPGNSPYASFSAFAGNTLLISPAKLVEISLLSPSDLDTIATFNSKKVDFDGVKAYKKGLFEKAFINFKAASQSLQKEYQSFCLEASDWLDDYALFLTIKKHYDLAPWPTWPPALKNRHPATLKRIQTQLASYIDYHKFLQFIFHLQWADLKAYAKAKSVSIIGDVPIFLTYDSVDVWSNQALFDLDENGIAQHVAGVPPDYFSEDGQLWGNPLYAWDHHAQSNYSWWKTRLRHMLSLVDYIRLDHFRGFESYWAIPKTAQTAKIGSWLKGPGHDFFRAIATDLGELPIIAEDLGHLTEKVHQLRKDFNLPGMKVLQFAFDQNNSNLYLPHHHEANSVVYTGTHDNNTILGWYQEAEEAVKDQIRNYINSDDQDIVWKMIRLGYASVANTVIIPMQDLQQLDGSHRMNTPGISAGCWTWRYTQDMLTPDIGDGLNYLRKLYNR